MIHVQLLIISIQYHDYMICYVIRGSKRPKVQNFDHLYPKQENIEKKLLKIMFLTLIFTGPII